MEQRVAQLERRIDELERAIAGGAVRLPRAEHADLETAIGLGWLNRVGAGLVIAGLALGAAWANERGYLSPVLRNALLALASAGVLGVGAYLLCARDASRRSFALGVAAVGAFGLYLAPITASRVDTVLSPSAAGAVTIALTLVLVAAARAHQLAALFTFALLGGLSVRVVGDGHPWSVAGPVLVGVLYVTAAARGWSLTIADHAAAVAATIGGVIVAYDMTASAWAPGVVGSIAAASWAVVRPRRDESNADVVLFSTAVVLIGVAWVMVASQWSSTHVGTTGAAAAYAIALVAAGVSWNNPLCRFIGLVALGGSVAKLVLHDVWHLPSGVRVGGLFLLGAGLLAASFLYSRFARADNPRP